VAPVASGDVVESSRAGSASSGRPRPSLRGGFLPSAAPRSIDAHAAVVAFVGGWVAAQLTSSLIVGALHDGSSGDATLGALTAGLVGAWVCYVTAMWLASQRAGSADFREDYGVTVAWIDLIGLGIGVVCQLVLLRVVYLPLEGLWPGTFTQDRLEENAQDLVDRAGTATWLLVLVVAVGAPIIEELFYRGLLQRSLLARFSDGLVIVGVAAMFALVHFRPVEFPGLFAFGLVLGVAAARTGRLGMPIMIHIGFNASALALVI
jgi:membrane protease YdiL (CAAX protease family)